MDHPHLLRCLPGRPDFAERMKRGPRHIGRWDGRDVCFVSPSRPSLTSMSSFQRIESASKTTSIPLPQVGNDRTEPNTMGMALLGKESTLPPPPNRRPTQPSTFTCAGKKAPGDKLLLYCVSWCWKSSITIKIAYCSCTRHLALTSYAVESNYVLFLVSHSSHFCVAFAIAMCSGILNQTVA